jgi:DNA-binding Xre family transcriptional regulator
MVRLTLHQLMRERGISAYALSRGTGLSYPSAYRMSRPTGTFGRLHADTLERLCEFFQLQPGELLRWTPGGQNGRKGRKGRPTVTMTAATGASAQSRRGRRSPAPS